MLLGNVDVHTWLVTVRKRSCGKVMFSQACIKNSVRGGGGRCTPVRADTPLGRHPPGQTPLRQTATAADDRHSTGMHFCSFMSSVNSYISRQCYPNKVFIPTNKAYLLFFSDLWGTACLRVMTHRA